MSTMIKKIKVTKCRNIRSRVIARKKLNEREEDTRLVVFGIIAWVN